MKFVIKNILAFVLIATGLNAVPAFAQEDDTKDWRNEFKDTSRRTEISFAWVMQGSGINFIHIDGGADSVNSNDVSRSSLELTISRYFDRFKTLGVEAVFGYTYASGLTQVPGNYFDPDNPVIFPVKSVDHKVFSYQGNIIYNFGYLEIVPFVFAGVGMNQFSPDEDSSFPLDGSYMNLSFGLGFKYFLKEWFGARVQVMDNYYFLGDEESQGNANQFRLSFGAVLTF